MRVLLVGHSYVRDLMHLGYNTFHTEGEKFEVEYIYQSGANYDTYLNDTSLLDPAYGFQPDYVIVILAGNSINNYTPNSEIYQKARDFYSVLGDRLPDAKIIAAQPELRFYSEDNHWDAPGTDEYRGRRNSFCNFLRRDKTKHAIMQISGPGRMDSKEYYSDGVHLNNVGLEKYFNIIKTCIGYHFRAGFQH